MPNKTLINLSYEDKSYLSLTVCYQTYKLQSFLNPSRQEQHTKRKTKTAITVLLLSHIKYNNNI